MSDNGSRGSTGKKSGPGSRPASWVWTRRCALTRNVPKPYIRSERLQLAGRACEPGSSSAALRVLVFCLGAERYALDFGDLVELLPLAAARRFRGRHRSSWGSSTFTGKSARWWTWAACWDSPISEEVASGYVVLVRKQGREVGLRVDRLDKIQQLPSDS